MNKHDWILANKEKALTKDRQLWDHLSIEAYPLTKGDLRLPISIEPFLIDSAGYERLTEHLIDFMHAAQKIATAYYTDPHIAEILAVDPQEIELIKASQNKSFSGIARLDLFYKDDAHVVEINTDYPDGFFMHDITAGAIRELLSDSIKINVKNHAQLFSDLLLAEGATKDMHIFIGYDAERFFIDEFHVAKKRLEDSGWKKVSVGTFENLKFEKGAFHYNKSKIDVLRRGSELSKIRKIDGLISQLIEAEKNGLIIVNNFKIRLLGYKSLLAALWDDKCRQYLNEKEIEAVEEILPETYKLDNKKISRKKLIDEKDKWVIKPIDLAEGTDVFVGQAKTDEEWATALKKAYTNPTKWIAQHKIAIPEAIFNLIEKNHSIVSSYLRKYDCNPHVILQNDNIDLGNILVRFSSSSVVNVAQGGGITYGFQTEK